jgi:hypothetical protein
MFGFEAGASGMAHLHFGPRANLTVRIAKFAVVCSPLSTTCKLPFTQRVVYPLQAIAGRA